jgi:bis(5'-nucleosidyl)-tetraphosphatase
MSARILSAGVVVLRWHYDHYRYLLLRAYDYWDFPKGQVEPGESPLEAAIREVAEETTIDDLKFRWGEIYRQTSPYNHGRKIARYYIAETSVSEIALPVNPLLGCAEHSDYRWATRQEAWEMITPRVRAILKWAEGVISRSPQPAPARLLPPPQSY